MVISRQGERSRSPSAASAPAGAAEGRLYVVATVHLDTQWRWTVQDTIRDLLPATLHRNFELIQRYPFFVVSFEGAFRYMLVQEYHPEEFERLRDLVAKGRWRLAGSMLDSPDVNVVSPESLIRHVLYGNGFFQEQFGRRSVDVFLPDCFGFGFALPSVAAHCGLAGFSSQKFGRWGAPAAIPFDIGVWQGPDGAEIIAALRPEGYGEGLSEDLSLAERYIRRIEATGERCGAFVGFKYVGVGDRGGGLDDASMRWLQRSVRGEGPIQVVVSGSDQIYRDLLPEQVARLPRYRGELLLPTHGTGCLTSQAELKRLNRRNELLADAAERSALMADWLGTVPYPADRLRKAWIRFLWHQMHDDLTGTSIPEAYRFTRNDLLLSLNEFRSILTHSIGATVAAMDTSGEGHPVAVFNPLSCERQDLVEVRLPSEVDPRSPVRAFASNGEEVPAQRCWSDTGRPMAVFLARLPPVAVEIYHLRFEQSPRDSAFGMSVGRSSLENHRYRVEIDADGDVSSIVDKSTGRQLLAHPVRLQLLRDRSSRWPAWEILYEDLQAKNPERVRGPANVRVLEDGPARVALEIVRRGRRSSFHQILRLGAEGAGDRLEIVNRVRWHTRGRMLKAVFPMSVSNPVAIYDLGLGVIERGTQRPAKYEVPAQQWAALTEAAGKGGTSILNDSKYGWDKPDERTIRLTLVRSPRVVRRFRHQGRQDFGEHRFTYGVYGHGDDWQISDTYWQAARLNQPLSAFHTTRHRGDLGRSFSLLRVSSPQVAVKALKRTESGERVLTRVQELSGEPAEDVEIRFAAPVIAAEEVNGSEEALPARQVMGQKWRLGLEAFTVKSFAVELSKLTGPSLRVRSRPLEIPLDVAAVGAQGRANARGFDGRGHSIPAELFPRRLRCGAIEFVLGTADEHEATALACRGQRLDLPAGDLHRLHLLAAAADGFVTGSFSVGDTDTELEIGPYSGLFGPKQRTRRRWWQSRSPETGICLGEGQEVAWVATHRHGPDGEDQPYVFCYLFCYGLDVPPGSRSLRLPDHPGIHVFAVTLSDESTSETFPAAPLYD